ncbi:LacI family DNA-binding transcriptional regulator [Actinoplanes couchii]|uniref:LacI family transcriptional regulator n=1 Tax=Actinoplanes couchii TaxID=403638 RepID=A0ABQ3X6P7_9ACTN|nr:LacI family DNA-binding transcriptional regulator [Actinoplanes couchii]MDR6322017.1 DNA-binding LacI/PurR family transcriptional regulator [Actinoplanes couchii]GID54181.1 LacI family transcriptional regulator [Actinoplanes couchii]
MATIADVARAAGVSPMTVSNVINGHPHVRDSTRAKVLAAMTALDYRVNVAARNLRRGRTGVIGLAVPEVNRPYFAQFAAAIIAAAQRRDLRVSIEQTGATRENELAVLGLSRNRLYDGLILSTVGMGAADTEHLKVPYPVVILGERIFNGPVDHVAMPNAGGARAAVRHLADRGCRRIAMLTGVETTEVGVSELRLTGYRLALQDLGLRYDPGLVQRMDEMSMGAAAERVHAMVTGGLDFDGLFCLTDTAAMGALRALADLAVAVPEDVKVIGFDNIEEGRFLVPSLSTVDPDHQAMAESAVGLLARRIDGGAGHEEFVSRFTVIARESTAV